MNDQSSVTATVVLTADQDWAPEWAMQIFVETLQVLDCPLHLFRTNHSESLEGPRATPLITDGWHPNFKDGSSHGKSIDDVIETMQRLFPSRTSVRAHSFVESSETWLKLRTAGMEVESHGLTDLQDHLFIQQMTSGLKRVLVYFEDDTYIPQDETQLNSERLLNGLDRPGLKVLNFHPIHVAMNTPNMAFYVENREKAYSGAPIIQRERYGTLNLLIDVIDFCSRRNIPIVRFPATSKQASACDEI